MRWTGRCSANALWTCCGRPVKCCDPEPGELLWDTGDTYDLYLVLADVPTVALEFHHGGNTAQRQPEDGPRCHRYDASITSASPSRTSTP